MVYNDTTTNQGILQECESILFDSDYGKITNSTALKQTFTRYANKALNKISSLILRYDNSWEFFDYNSNYLPIDTHNLVSGRDDYEVETYHKKLLKVRIKDPNGNWKTLKHISRRQLTDSELAETGTPEYFDPLGSFVMFIPTPNYSFTNGLELQFQDAMEFFATTDTEKEPGFDSMFHPLVPMWMSYFYAFAKRLDIAKDLRQEIVVMEEELKEYINQRNYSVTPNLTVSKEDFGSVELGTLGRFDNNPRGF